jgi:hypothetical protein
MLLCFSMAAAEASLISDLAKLGKLGKADTELPLKQRVLPESYAGYEAVRLVPAVDGSWSVRLADGRKLALDALVKLREKDKKLFLLVIDAMNLPDELSAFDNIPSALPVLVASKNQLFELHRDKQYFLVFKQVQLPITSVRNLHQALWHFQRSVTFGRIHLLHLDNDPDKAMPHVNLAASYEFNSVGSQALKTSLGPFRFQTLVLSGPISDGQLLATINRQSSIVIDRLQQMAQDEDVNLIILESRYPASLLKDLSSGLHSEQIVADNTGEFLNRFIAEDQSPATLKLHDSGQQTLIHYQAGIEPKLDDIVLLTNKDILINLPLHLAISSIKIYRPDQLRSEELDVRIIKAVPSWIQVYVIFSTVLGLLAWSISRKLWNKVWLLKRRKTYGSSLAFLTRWWLHSVLFLLLFLPLLGWLCFVYLMLSFLMGLLNFLFFKPVKWLYRLF